VDDNGVGADKLVSIVADLYADDFSRDPQETIQRITEDLQRLASGGQVVRYRGLHNGSSKDLLYVRKWKQHQVVNHPSKGHQYPLPPADLIDTPPPLQTLSGDSLDTLSHEQGNRGSEQGSEEAATAAPSRLCAKHRNFSGPVPDCPPCGSARRAFEAWEAGDMDRRRKRKEATAQRKRDCPDCDQWGHIEVIDDDGTEGVRDCPKNHDLEVSA
jgi:hypothetical protein